MIRLEWEMAYSLRSSKPLFETGGSPRGARRYYEMQDAVLDGPRIKARAPLAGGDWMQVGPDGLGRPDVRVQFVTDDWATVLLHYTGTLADLRLMRCERFSGNNMIAK
jgi:hypothetical protein